MGWGWNASIMRTSLQGQQEIYWYFDKEIKQQSLINQHCDLNWTIHGCFERNSMFWTPVHCLFSTCHALKTWFELSRVKLYRNSPEGNKNYFDRVSGRFELSRVRITKGKCIMRNPGEIDFVSSWRGFELSEVDCKTRLIDGIFDYKWVYIGNSPSTNLVSRRSWMDVYSRAN